MTFTRSVLALRAKMAEIELNSGLEKSFGFFRKILLRKILARFCDSEAILRASSSQKSEELRAQLKLNAPTPLPPGISEACPRFRSGSSQILRICSIYRAKASDLASFARPFAFCVSHFVRNWKA